MNSPQKGIYSPFMARRDGGPSDLGTNLQYNLSEERDFLADSRVHVSRKMLITHRRPEFSQRREHVADYGSMPSSKGVFVLQEQRDDIGSVQPKLTDNMSVSHHKPHNSGRPQEQRYLNRAYSGVSEAVRGELLPPLGQPRKPPQRHTSQPFQHRSSLPHQHLHLRTSRSPQDFNLRTSKPPQHLHLQTLRSSQPFHLQTPDTVQPFHHQSNLSPQHSIHGAGEMQRQIEAIDMRQQQILDGFVFTDDEDNGVRSPVKDSTPVQNRSPVPNPSPAQSNAPVPSTSARTSVTVGQAAPACRPGPRTWNGHDLTDAEAWALALYDPNGLGVAPEQRRALGLAPSGVGADDGLTAGRLDWVSRHTGRVQVKRGLPVDTSKVEQRKAKLPKTTGPSFASVILDNAKKARLLAKKVKVAKGVDGTKGKATKATKLSPKRAGGSANPKTSTRSKSAADEASLREWAAGVLDRRELVSKRATADGQAVPKPRADAATVPKKLPGGPASPVRQKRTPAAKDIQKVAGKTSMKARPKTVSKRPSQVQIVRKAAEGALTPSGADVSAGKREAVRPHGVEGTGENGEKEPNLQGAAVAGAERGAMQPWREQHAPAPLAPRFDAPDGTSYALDGNSAATPVPTLRQSTVRPTSVGGSMSPEVTGRGGLAREESQATDADRYHWEYHVKRKSWRSDAEEHQAQWYLVGPSNHTSLAAANDAAGREVLLEREGLAVTPFARQWRRDLDRFDMANYFVQLPDGCFRVHVDRVLRDRSAGRLPVSKAGWLKKTAWDIMRKTTTKTTVAEDLFGDEVATETTAIEVVDGIFTVLDDANREAGKAALALRAPFPETSLRIEHQLKRREALKEMEARLDRLEHQNEAFKETIKVSEGKSVELWVQARTLKGPRNG